MTFRQEVLLRLIDKLVIGLLLVVVGLLVNRELENFKNQVATKNDIAKKQRIAVADFATKLGKGVQAVEWLNWKAKNDPKEFSKEDIDNYDNEMKAILPEIVGAR